MELKVQVEQQQVQVQGRNPKAKPEQAKPNRKRMHVVISSDDEE